MNLTNNSNEMKTIVETFVIEETAELIYDNEKLDKWNEYVTELGLSGQSKIVKPDKSPIPFLHIKRSLEEVLLCLCPKQVNVEEYDISPIPVEILELVALSKRENYFSTIEIWYDDKSPDPVCIGKKATYYTYSKSYSTIIRGLSLEQAKEEKKSNPDVMSYNEENAGLYLIGKWADVKHSFEELKEMAIKRYIGQKNNEFKKAIQKAERGLLDLQTEAFDRFN